MLDSVRLRLLVVLAFTALVGCRSGGHGHDHDRIGASYAMHAPDYPERVTLTWDGDPATRFVANWHTRAETPARAEIARADASPNFREHAAELAGRTETIAALPDSGYFHHVRFTGLDPDTLCAYRVGDGETWSSWYHHRTAATELRPFTFIYLGDAQNEILSLWSRAIRGAYADAAEARFVIHAGDLVNRADAGEEWAEWHEAAGWIFAMVPSVATPGNHEYAKGDDGRRLSHFWRPTFAFPENGPPGLEETVYHLDFQGVRLISLNSIKPGPEQTAWLEQVLAENPHRWTVVTFHHPLYATKAERDHPALRKAWGPLFARYGVDLVLQGHDHAYGRGQNLPVGERATDAGGTVYVVSVSGPKMYDVTPGLSWATRTAENTQLYQVIEVEADRLRYRAKTVTGEVYDAFDLLRREGQPNQLVEVTPELGERSFENTLLRRD